MMNNGGNIYPSQYRPMPFSGARSGFSLTPLAVQPYYIHTFQRSQQKVQKSHQRLSKKQGHETNMHPQLFKIYDLETNEDNGVIRLMFSFAGIAYKIKLLKEEEWIRIQEQSLFDSLPVLRINYQFKICEQNAIMRYLAREFHLYGTGHHDHAIVDVVYETIRPLREKILEETHGSTDPEQKLKQLVADHSAKYLHQLEKLYNTFKRHGPFYLGTHISLADLIVYDTINYLLKADEKLLDNYPRLKEAHRRLRKNPRLSNYPSTKVHDGETKLNQNQQEKPDRNRRHRTKSPALTEISHHRHHHHHHHQRRRRSHDASEIGHYHHHHHHHHHRHHRHSKEPTPVSPSKQSSIRASQSPSISMREKETIPLPQPKLSSMRSSKSPSELAKDKEQVPLTQHKTQSVRSSNSPVSFKGSRKEGTKLRGTDVVPQPPPPPVPPPPPAPVATAEHKS